MSGFKFQPPIPNRFLYAFFQSINHPILSRGVTWIIEPESWAHWKALPPGSAYFIASKHAHFTDHFCIAGVASRLGISCLFVSIPEAFEEYWGLAGMVVRRLGGFAVERGGTNIQATRYIVEALVKADHPLVIFPEGELYFLNDVVTPLKIGTALFALEGAKAREHAGKPESTYILPVGLKYVYPGDAAPFLMEKLIFCEKKFYKKAQSGVLQSRIFKLVSDVQERSESVYHLQGEGKTPEEKFFSLSRQLLEQLEGEAHGKVFDGDLSDRGRRLMVWFKKKSPQYEKAKFALHCLDFLPGYLNEPTQERFMETLRKLERLITGNENPSFPGKRNLFVKIEKPLAVHRYLPAYLDRRIRKDALGQLTSDLQTALQGSINAIRQQLQFPRMRLAGEGS